MVLEAVAAVGLVGNIIQFIDFSCKLLSLSSDINNSTDGSASVHADIVAIANDLKGHTDALERSQWTGARPDDLLDRVDGVARDLLFTINLINKKKSNGNRWRSFRQALESVWKQDRIKKFLERLEALRAELQYHIIVETRNDQHHIKETLEKFSQRAIYEPEIRSRLTELAKVVKDIDRYLSKVETKSQVPSNQSQLYATLMRPNKKFNILKSLEFSDMTIRYSSIVEAHLRTFEWIFTPGPSTDETLSSSVGLSNWLERGNGVYWITGKPGAGKSTLMKFIDNHTARIELLQRWAQPFRLVTASFYFWNPGTSMQKCLQGLLQSLLHKILFSCPGLIDVLCPERWISNDTADVMSSPWTLSELQAAFGRLENESTLSTRFFFLIDGLDECEGDLYELVDLIQRLSKQPHLKLCVSSRPWNQFHRTIGMSNNGFLELHKLTKGDIELFARESILSHSRRLYPNTTVAQYEDLVQEIAERAQGVFLWVRLVVHSLRDGIANNDQPSLLMERLEDIPTALEEFFELILQSVDKVYHKRMARTFLAGLATNVPMTLLHYAFLEDDDNFQQWDIKYKTMTDKELSDRLSQTRIRLNGRYLGLLEPAQLPISLESENTTVSFLHRTLRDYLRTFKMQKFLGSLAPPNFDAARLVAGISFATIVSTSEMPLPEVFADVLRFGNFVSGSEKDPSFEYEVIDKVEEIIQATWRKVTPSDLMLRAAIHNRQLGYVKHRVKILGDLADKDWLLAHSVTDCCWSQSFSAHFESAMTIQQIHQCTCANLDAFCKGKHPKRETSFAETLHQDWFAQVASVFIDTSWLGHPTLFEERLGGVCNRRNWNLIKFLMSKGRKVLGEHWVWSHMASRSQGLNDTDLMSLLDGFCYVLQNHVVPDAPTFVALLFSLHKKRPAPRIRTLLAELISLFLTHGIDITRSITEPCSIYKLQEGRGTITEPCSIYKLQEGRGIWFHFFCDKLRWGQPFFCGFEPHVLLEMFFQHGLDPNQPLGCSTIWEHLLMSFLRPLSATNYRTQTKMISLFLKFRADPYSAKLNAFMKGRHGHSCPIPEPEATEIKDLIRAERADLSSRSQPHEMHGAPISTLSNVAHRAEGVEQLRSIKREHTQYDVEVPTKRSKLR